MKKIQAQVLMIESKLIVIAAGVLAKAEFIFRRTKSSFLLTFQLLNSKGQARFVLHCMRYVR